MEQEMKLNSRLMALLVAILAIFGLTTPPANAAAKSISLGPVTATLANNIAELRFTVKCDSSLIYQFQILHVFQGDTVGFNDDPAFAFTPCGSSEIQIAPGMTGLFTTGKAQLHIIFNLCEAANPTVCTNPEIWKNIRLRSGGRGVDAAQVKPRRPRVGAPRRAPPASPRR